MRRLLAITTLAVLALTPAATGAAGTEPTFPEVPPPDPQREEALVIVSESTGAVVKRRPACRTAQTRRPREFEPTQAAPPQTMLDILAVLRRPAQDADRLTKDELREYWSPVSVAYVRMARRLPDGTRIFLAPIIHAGPIAMPRDRRCSGWERQALERRLEGRSMPLRRTARKQLAQLQDLQAALEREVPAPHLVIRQIRPNDADYGPYAFVATRPLLPSLSNELDAATPFTIEPLHRGSRLIVVVPDGVASIDVVLPRGRSPFGNRFVYRKAVRRTAHVINNVAVLRFDRGSADALPASITWRSADGTAVPGGVS